MKVILPIDFSEFSDAAIGEVERRPWPENTSLRLLHVIDTVSISSGWLDISPYIESQTGSATILIREVARRLSSTGLQISDVILCGYPPALISEYAEEWGADLVIVGSHGAGRLVRFLLGSVANSVLRATHCSVGIVRKRPKDEPGKPMKILMATDGCEYSERAARSIAERPWPKDSIVKILHVAELPPAGVEPWNAATWFVEDLRNQRMKDTRDLLARAERIISSAELETLTEVVSGHASVTIIDKAKEWGAGLVVLGSHGRRGFKRLLLGSVAEAVALHAHCSVEVIRPPEVPQEDQESCDSADSHAG